MIRVMPKVGDEFETILKQMKYPSIWVNKFFKINNKKFIKNWFLHIKAGAVMNNYNVTYYWDDGRKFDRKLLSTNSGGCVEIFFNNTDIYYDSAPCSGYTAQTACFHSNTNSQI